MKIFKLSLFALASAFALGALPSVSHAEPIDYFIGSVATGGITGWQLGRPSRNGVAQTWLSSEAYLGAINTTVTYYYHTYTYASSLFTGAPYIDISVFDDSNANNFFVSAYAISYNSASPATNWLGDIGQSGNFSGYDAEDFYVVLPVGDSLVLVVNNTAAGGAEINSPYEIAVNAYADTMYDDPAAPTSPSPVPEPSTLVTLGTGVIGVAGALRRRALKK